MIALTCPVCRFSERLTGACAPAAAEENKKRCAGCYSIHSAVTHKAKGNADKGRDCTRHGIKEKHFTLVKRAEFPYNIRVRCGFAVVYGDESTCIGCRVLAHPAAIALFCFLVAYYNREMSVLQGHIWDFVPRVSHSMHNLFVEVLTSILSSSEVIRGCFYFVSFRRLK
ncbi:MAG: hypothetical protein IJ049_05820 [Oscillospiraceae bacterium]|nr:hypothetical protein [Oscillospiraceae bacterium]